MTPPMEFCILGPLEVRVGGEPLDLGGEKQRALLALLLLEANRVVPRDRLIDGLWEESPPETAHKALQVYVSQLRKILGPDRLETRNPGYLLHLASDELDAARFIRLQEDGRPDAGLELWRGPALADLTHLHFAQPAAARLEELRLACLDDRVAAALDAGRHAEIAGELEALVREHPLRESLRAHQMLCLYRCGRQADALEAFQAARAALVDELGIEPGRRLRELQEAILRQDPSLEPPARVAESGTASGQAPFVGREAELAELLEGFEDAAAGSGRLFLVAGEPGIGKSRLMEEVAAHARPRGARVLVGRCWEAGGAPAYWPWVQSLRAYVRETPARELRDQLGEGAIHLAQVLPELRRDFPDLSVGDGLDDEGARFRLFDATSEFLLNASASRPIVLMLDDLHAADGSSLLLLRYLAREIGTARLLVIAAYRDVDPSPAPALKDLLAEAAREPGTRRISLTGLDRDEVAEYVELTAAELASPELLAVLHDNAEGNPLFVGELLRMVAAEGPALDDDGEVRMALPQSVRDVIARRLTRLSDECNRVLRVASALGREFRLDVVARLAGVSEDELLESLDEAIAAGVVASLPGGAARLRFSHVLVRDTLYDGLTTAKRVRLHRLVVDTLEELHGQEPGPALAQLAHHAVAGRDFERGVGYARRAGDRALALLAFEEAVRQYEVALDALDLASSGDDLARCELLLALGQAAARAGDTPHAKSAFWEAAGLARITGRPVDLARAALGYGGRIVWGRGVEDGRLVPLLEEALARLPTAELGLRVRLLARLSGALRDDPVPDRRDRLSAEAVELARAGGDAAGLANALNGRAASIIALDRLTDVYELASELLELAERNGEREWAVQALTHLDFAQLFAGDVAGAQASADRAWAIAQELRQPAEMWLAAGIRSMIAIACGRLQDADEVVERTLQLGERTQGQAAHACAVVQRHTLSDLRGRPQEAEEPVRRMAVEAPTRPIFRCLLAHIHARIGRAEEARAALGELIEAVPFDQEWLFSMSLLAETCSLLGDVEHSARLYDLLLPWAHMNVVDQAEGMRGAAGRYLGLLAATLGRREEAAAHYEAALEANARMGALPWLARTREDYAAMLAARAAPSDEIRARELRTLAAEDYAGMGLA